MAAKAGDLHGSAPDTAPVALLLIDVINDLEFEGGELLARYALGMGERIAALKARAKAAGIPVIYVNDNWGRWQSDVRKIVEHACRDGARGKALVERLVPDEDEYFVLKPKHSGFFSTTLDTLLDYLGARTLILTGVAGNICVLFTANDAYMRDFRLVIPADCIAANEADDNAHALAQMRAIFKADTTPSSELDLNRLKREAGRQAKAAGSQA